MTIRVAVSTCRLPTGGRMGKDRPLRCRLGIHSFGFYWRDYGPMEPPDREFYCCECGKDGMPWRTRFWTWFWEIEVFGKPLAEWVTPL